MARPRPFGFEITNSSMDNIATALSIRADRPVINMTGLSGVYDVKLDWSAYQNAPSADPPTGADEIHINPMAAPADPTVMLRSLASVGLRADARKIPLKFLVVDHAEKIPTAN